ncbi:MAG: hypothetical protein DRJ01_04980 [Bacteroidetes bacterium]|nr:MAG: hypothetical protein DRJ01_04980 [Bacteroidota bacterium]
MNRPEIISKLSFYLIDKEPMIYLFIINSDFVKDEWGLLNQVKENGEIWEGYAGVNYSNNRVKFVYTDSFLKLPIEQMYFVLIHEAEHIFKHHSKGLHDHLKNFKLVNICQDAIINDEINEMKFLGLKPEPPTEVGGCTIPDAFKNHYYKLKKEAYTTPRLYAWYENKRKPQDKKEFLLSAGFCKDENGKYSSIGYDPREEGKIVICKMPSKEAMIGNSKGENNLGDYEKVEIETLTPVIIANQDSIYLKAEEETYNAEVIGYGDPDISEAPELKDEEDESIIPQRIFIENLVQQADKMIEGNPALQAARKLAGVTEGNSLSGAVKSLLKSQVSWKKEFKQGLNIFLSDRGSTPGYKKSYITHLMNPRSRYGMLGKHRLKTRTKNQNYIIIALDTSGSCFYDEYDKQRFFTEIDEITRELEFNQSGKVYILMWDYSVANENIYEYKVGDWKTYQLKGGGGTNPRNVFRHLEKRSEIIGNSIDMKLNEKEHIFIKDKKKLPFLLFLTDGYFYDTLRDRDLRLYEKDKESLMFLTKIDRYIPKGIKRVLYK